MSRDPDVPPVSPDRPFVDATDRSPEDLRAELEQLTDPLLDDAEANVRQVREELRVTVSELVERLAVPTRARRGAARLTAAGAGVLLLVLVFRRWSAQYR
jgi:hypothetical protein